MQTVSATYAKQNFAAILDQSQREPVRIQRLERDIAVINSATAAAPALPFFFFVMVSALFIFHKIGCGDWGVGLSSTPDRAPTRMINFAQTTALVEVSVDRQELALPPPPRITPAPASEQKKNH